MTAIMDLINFFDHNTKEYQEFLQDLLCSNGDVPFDIEEVDKAQDIIISTINSLLNRSQTRYNGLLILDKILTQCSKDVLSKYCMLWISKATQVLESIHNSPQEITVSCKVLGCLIIQSKDIPEVQKQIFMQNVKQLINAIGNISLEKKCGSIYYLLAVLLHQYPEVCERFQVSIKKIVLLQIDSTEANLVNASAKCYALLAKATERSFKPPASKATFTSWIYNEALICNSLHAIMDDLFSNLVELENINIWDQLTLPNIPEENIIQYYFKQKQRFLNLCSYLSCMLCGFDKRNSVLPHEILKVLCRGLAIQPSNLKKQNSVKEQILYLILPKLHIALLNVLDALINGFKEQLVPFGSTILQLFLQTLQWTESILENQVTISGNKPFRNVRVSLYKCLTSWLVNTNSLSGVETVADEYLPSILKDIVPERDRVLLTIQKTQNLSKRAMKRLRDSQYEKSTYLNNGIGSNKEYYLDVDICKGALTTLQNIFFNAGSLLKQTFFKIVQNIIIPLLYDSYLSSTEQKFYKENPECRLLLLRVLRALQVNPHSLVPLPTQYSIEIFEMALSDTDLYNTQEAKVALAELEKLLHPHAPSIQLTQTEIIQKEFAINDENTEHNDTLEDTSAIEAENLVDDDMAPSSSKKIKITDTRVDVSIESTVQNTTDVELNLKQTNEGSLENEINCNVIEKEILNNSKEEEITVNAKEKEVTENSKKKETIHTITEKQISIMMTKNNISENEAPPESSITKTLGETESITVECGTSENVEIKVCSTSSSSLIIEKSENKNTSETNYNLKNITETSEVNQECLSTENEKEEEEILQLFQDVPKN